jgi:hypothetical protein
MRVVTRLLAATGCVVCIVSTGARGQECPEFALAPGGALVETAFLPVPPERAKEVVADAMQAAGAVPSKTTVTRVEMTRVKDRFASMGLAEGDEAITATFEAAVRDDVAGTSVRVETSRSRRRQGTPKQNWSRAVLTEAACLATLLAPVEPREHGRSVEAGSRLIVPPGTPLTLRLRRFVFSGTVRPDRALAFEVAADVEAGGQVVIRKGALARARFSKARDVGELGAPASGTLVFEFVVAADGSRIPVRGTRWFEGRDRADSAIPLLAVFGERLTGGSFALRAGTAFGVAVDREN